MSGIPKGTNNKKTKTKKNAHLSVHSWMESKVCVCVCVCEIISLVGVIFVYVDTVFGFYGYSFLCLVGCFSMIIWTPAALSVLYACVLYFCICTCSAQLIMFHMERRSKNRLIIIIIKVIWLLHIMVNIKDVLVVSR